MWTNEWNEWMNEWRNEMNWRMNGMWMKWMDKWIQLMKWIHATSSYSSQLYPRNQWDTVGYVHIANAESFCLEGRIALSIYLPIFWTERLCLEGRGGLIYHTVGTKKQKFSANCMVYEYIRIPSDGNLLECLCLTVILNTHATRPHQHEQKHRKT